MSELRSPPARRLVFALSVALGLGLVGACGDDDNVTPPGASPDTVSNYDVGPGLDAGTTPDIVTPGDATGSGDAILPPDMTVGEPDNPIGAGVVIDEAGMRATVDGNDLVILVPISSVDGERVKGKLRAIVRLVDGTGTASTGEGSFDVQAGALKDVEVRVTMPEVVDQGDLARWVVRIEDSWTAMGTGPKVTRSLLHLLPPWELTLEGPKTVLAGRDTSWRVRATDPVAHEPLADVPVRLVVVGEDGKPMQLDAATGLTGDVIFPLDLPTEGAYDVTASGWSQGVTAQLSEQIEVTASPRRVLLTTDKPIYQPGQVIHLRALALEKPDLAPITDQAVTFEVEDGKGNKILKRDVVADGWGIAATDFQLGKILNQGTFKVRALLGETKTEKTVEVSTYTLPKFKVGVTVAAPWYMPGMTVEGAIDAVYFFGKPIAGGSVDIVASSLDVDATEFAHVTGKTDGTGHMAFSVKLPDVLVGLPLEQGMALVQLAVTVTDTADQVVEKNVPVLVSAEPARILIVPEGGDLVPGAENHVHVFVSDPLGAPVAGTAVTLKSALLTAPVDLVTDAFGYAAMLVDVPANAQQEAVTFEATAALPGGVTAKASVAFDLQGGADHVLVRTEKAIYSVGETVNVQIVTTGLSKHVYIDWINQGQVVDMRTLDAKDGKASMAVDLDASLRGDNAIEAYIVDGNGQIVRATRSLFVKDAKDLSVSLSTDKPQYAPGEEAKLTFTVKTEEGKATAAALGVQIVDQAVFALIDAQPGLLKTYFELNDALAQPQYEIHGATWDLVDVIYGGSGSANAGEADAAQKKAEASFAAMGTGAVTGIHLSSWLDLPARVKEVLQPFWTVEREGLVALYKTAGQAAVDSLTAKGCQAGWYWCEALDKEYLAAFAEEMDAQVHAWDFWGNRYGAVSGQGAGFLKVRSWGPDEVDGTGDDWTVTLDWEELDLPQELRWFGRPDVDNDGGGAGGGGGGPNAGGGGGDPTSEGGEDGEEGPRVRTDFPETLYVNPALIAGGDGKATVTIPMADSITEWRVTSMAHSKDGRLGSGIAGVTVFQDFFVDIDFPATLTRGDEVTFPIAIYNYLDEPQTVTLTLEPASWYTPLGATELEVNLAPQQVVSAKFPVRVDTVGLFGLTVKGIGTKLSDAVHRTVKVVPDGKEFAVTHSGALEAGDVAYDVTFPPDAVPGSQVMYVNVYPAYLTQVVEGLDAMLSVPYG